MKLTLMYCWFLFGSVSTFARHPFFNQYKVPVYSGRRKPLVIKGNALVELYRTVITDTYYAKNNQPAWHPTGLNFGGHYCFIYWGCGSPCQSSAVVDFKTGIVYPGVDASYGYKFKRNSRLIVVNPNGEQISSTYKTEYWVWNEKTKRFDRRSRINRKDDDFF